VQYRGGLNLALDPGTECGCLTGTLTPEKCLAIAVGMADRFQVVAGVDPGDGYSPGMSGLPDRLVSVTFKNGAVLHMATNHLFLVGCCIVQDEPRLTAPASALE